MPRIRCSAQYTDVPKTSCMKRVVRNTCGRSTTKKNLTLVKNVVLANLKANVDLSTPWLISVSVNGIGKSLTTVLNTYRWPRQ